MPPAPIVILNGIPRSGRSVVVEALQDQSGRIWVNLGIDVYSHHIAPPRTLPGLGLAPGEDRGEIKKLLPVFYAALYDSIAAHSRLGLAVVADLAHHVATPEGRAILEDCARRLAGLPVLFVGLHAPDEIIEERLRRPAPLTENGEEEEAPPPTAEIIAQWKEALFAPGIYDIEIDTSLTSAADCADLIEETLKNLKSPTAFERLAGEAANGGKG